MVPTQCGEVTVAPRRLHRVSRRLQSTADASTRGVIPGHTGVMKTAISLPDETYERASRRAVDLGLSRSEFFARAAQRYLDDLDAQSLTGQIDDALDRGGVTDDAAADAIAVGHRLVAGTDDEW